MFRIFVLALSLAFAAFPALATTTANSIVTPQVPNRGIVQFLQGTDSAGTYKTLYTGGANGSKCVGIYATSNDASASHLVTVQIKVSTVYYGGMAVTVPVNSGFANAAPAVNMMAPANWPACRSIATAIRSSTSPPAICWWQPSRPISRLPTF